MTVIQNLMLAPMKVRKISKKEAYDRGMQLLKKSGWKTRQTTSLRSSPVGSSSVSLSPARSR